MRNPPNTFLRTGLQVRSCIKITEDKSIANHFNTYFSKIGTNLAASLDSNNLKDFKLYLNKNFNHTFELELVNENEIMKIINELQPKNSNGQDEISNKLLKIISNTYSVLNSYN